MVTLIAFALWAVMVASAFAEEKLTLPYSSTFNCTATQFSSFAAFIPCDHLPSAWQGYSAVSGNYTEITSSANYPSGTAGTKGYRVYIGTTVNEYSSPVDYHFNTNQSEFYVRFYVRWQSGFTWGSDPNNGQKIIYVADAGGSALFYFNWANGFVRVSDGAFIRSNGSYGVTNFWNAGGTSSTADASWHCVEMRVKAPTSSGASNGIVQWWIDDVLRLNYSDVPIADTTFQHFVLPSNGNGNENGSVQYQEFDDVAISNTGRIGCLAGGKLDLVAPSKVQVATP